MSNSGQATEQRREYRISRTRLQHGYLLGGVLIAFGIVIPTLLGGAIPDSGLIGLAHVAAGGGIILWTRRAASDTTPRLVLDSAGIWYRDWGTRAIPWAQIRDASITGSRMNSYLAVEVRNADRLMHIIPTTDRQKFRSNRLVNLPRLFIPNHAVDATLQQLHDDIRAAAEHYRR